MANGSAGSIYVDLLLRDARYTQGLNKARNSTRSATKGMSSDFSALSGMVKGLAGSLAAGLSVQKVIQFSDEFASLTGRLNLVAQSADDLANTQDRLFKISQETRTSLSATTTLYQRLTSAVKGLGVSQEEVFLFTEQLNKQLITAGLTSNEASAAIFQLTQAFNKGKLDGDEFRTILESAPPILEALEKSLGKTRGEILEMSKAGELAPRVLIDAVNSMADTTDKRFADFRLTVGQSFTQLNNSILSFIGNNDLVSESVSGVAKSISELSRVIDTYNDNVGVSNRLLYGLGALLLDTAISWNKFTIAVNESFGILGSTKKIDQARENIRGLQDDLERAGQRLLDFNNTKLDERDSSPPTISFANIPSETDKDKKLREKAEKEYIKRQKELQGIYKNNRVYIDGITAAEAARIDKVAELTELLGTKYIPNQEALTRAIDAYDKEMEESNKKMSQFAKQAARNIQDSFADFLFDPFEDGMKGMLQSFSDTLRRMAAEAAAAKLMESLFGNLLGGSGKDKGLLGGFFDGMFSKFAGGFATGGTIPAGQWGVVGEQGPELAFGGNTGQTIIPQGNIKGGGVSVNVINNSSANIRTQQGSNGASIDVIIDEAVANNILSPGSRTNAAMNSYNKQGMIRR